MSDLDLEDGSVRPKFRLTDDQSLDESTYLMTCVEKNGTVRGDAK
jgi:hypothetical protein